MEDQNIIFYNTADGKVKVALMAKDGEKEYNILLKYKTNYYENSSK